MSSEDILTKPPPKPDRSLTYGPDPNQFMEARIPGGKGPHPVLLNVHGGYWRAKYGLAHAGHLCEAVRKAGVATFNVEYRRVGNDGGGWPGTFADVRTAYRFIRQEAPAFHLDLQRLVVMGHSAGGQLALCLAAHEKSVRNAISLAGVVDLERAFTLHLSNDAVVEFMGGKPNEVPDHYREADPMRLPIPQARQWLLHGLQDDTVPLELSSHYVAHKKKDGEHVELIELGHAGHFELIDPYSEAFPKVSDTIRKALR